MSADGGQRVRLSQFVYPEENQLEIILRTLAIYVVLDLLFRVLGKRSMSELSAFDFILFLIISEAIQNASQVRAGG